MDRSLRQVEVTENQIQEAGPALVVTQGSSQQEASNLGKKAGGAKRAQKRKRSAADKTNKKRQNVKKVLSKVVAALGELDSSEDEPGSSSESDSDDDVSQGAARLQGTSPHGALMLGTGEPLQAGRFMHLPDPKAKCMEYHVEQCIINEILADKYVPLFKLLKGYKQLHMGAAINDGQLIFTEGRANKKLESQSLPLDLLLLAMLKYIEIVKPCNAAKAADIYRHMNNVIYISAVYDNDAFFTYHNYVWSHFFGQNCIVWGGNFRDIDTSGLHASFGRTALSYCEHCANWLHKSNDCPFQVRNIAGDGRRVGPQPRQYHHHYCKYFNFPSGCSAAKKGLNCTHPHVCAFCGKDHSVVRCISAPKHFTA